MAFDMGRRGFLQAGTAAAAGAFLKNLSQAKKVHAADKTVRLGFVGIGSRGSFHLDCALGMEGVEVPALCDNNETVLQRARQWVLDSGKREPALYGKGDRDFVRMFEREELDAIICSTSWDWHAPVCIAAMENGKHAVSEVPIVLTVDEAWELVETAEKTGKWATLGLEQAFTEKPDLLAMYNMVRQGVFGQLVHCEDGYVHDLRYNKFFPSNNDNPQRTTWRLEHSITRNGNLYPDHPMAKIIPVMDINHGDRLDYLVSVSSRAVSLNEYAAEKLGKDHKYATMEMAQGDYNAALIRTVQGKLITLNFDTNTPHPREIFRMQGTKGVYYRARGIGSYIYLDGISPQAHQWEPAEPYYKKYEHPMFANYVPKRRKAIRGHGGGSTVPLTWERLIRAIREGTSPDYDVYDSVISSIISPLTEQSVANKGKPVDVPDFTRGKWKTRPPIEYV